MNRLIGFNTKIFLFLICSFTSLFLLIVVANGTILRYQKNIIHETDSVPTTSIALIFGGGMKNATEMGETQTDRVLQGIELYKKHKVTTLVMTGDDGAWHGNEVDAMKNFALEHGVTSSAILIDPHGYTTYRSCARASTTFHFSHVIAISQNFHLPRILFLCRSFGIETDGLSADLRPYDRMLYNETREIGARVKAWLMVTRDRLERLFSE